MMDAAPQSDEFDFSGVSKTAIWVAAARAIGAREPDPAVRNPDWLAEKLLGDAAERIIDHPIVRARQLDYDEAMQNTEIADTVRAMIERTRFIDAALERAVADGATQVLIPGAGMDSHAYRFRDLLESVAVFEVDKAATLEFKRSRVEAALGGPPANLTYLPLDVGNRELPELLAEHGYDLAKKTFVILEGVTMYLKEDVLRELFRFVAAHAPGSRIVFDFASAAIVASFSNIDIEKVPAAMRPSIERFLDLFSREPWYFGFPIGGEAEYLAELGLE